MDNSEKKILLLILYFGIGIFALIMGISWTVELYEYLENYSVLQFWIVFAFGLTALTFYFGMRILVNQKKLL